jgi:glycosyltransferase involved in cell wall biosynthesis
VDTTGAGLKAIAIISEELFSPLDEGFKKATALLAGGIADLGVRTTLFAQDVEPGETSAGRLPRNKLLLGPGFASRLRKINADGLLYVPQAAATPMSVLRAWMLKRQSGGLPVALLSLQMRHYPGVLSPLLRIMRPDLILTLSGRNRAAAEMAGLPARAVPLGVDSRTFRPPQPGEKEALRHRYGIPEGKVLLHVGHVSPKRNLELLRLAASSGRRLVIVASTSTSSDPEVRRGFEGTPVVFLETYVEHVEEIYRAADCYLFPTFNPKGAIELPLSVLEAMASNLPVVATDFGGIPDFFQEDRGLFIASSPKQFLEKLERALVMTDVATRDLVADMTWQTAAARVIEAMEELEG